MNKNILNTMLEKYNITSRDEGEKALREILQEIVLVGIWRAKLFEQMAFYGGTALRILHGLERFSEDIDFTLVKKNPSFKWAPFAKTIEDELRSYGFDFELKEKSKSFTTEIESAFLKANTLKALLHVEVPKGLLKGLHPESSLKIKIEVDTDPVLGFRTEQETLRFPLPVPINTVVLPDLFASKLHAALFRAWKNRVKGRDWYDVIWYIRNNVPLNIDHFKSCMKHNQIQCENIEELDIASLKELIFHKLEHLDIESAKTDVKFFVRPYELPLIESWSQGYIAGWIDKLILEQ
jgi:predicted nucleotidyltransferase component of viral defense system